MQQTVLAFPLPHNSIYSISQKKDLLPSIITQTFQNEKGLQTCDHIKEKDPILIGHGKYLENLCSVSKFEK